MLARFLLALAAVALLSGCAAIADFYEGPDSRRERSVPPHEQRALDSAAVPTTPAPAPPAAAPPAAAPEPAPARLVADATPAPAPAAADDLPPLDLTTPAPEPAAPAASPAPAGPITSEPIAARPRPASPPAAEPDAVPAPPAVSEQIPRTIFDLHTIYFKSDSADIPRAGRDLLDENARMLRDNRRVHAVVEGHSDATGSPRYNRDLSRRRAEAVVAYLVERGIARDRLEVAVYGEDRPLDPASTPSARAKNRRVQFLVFFPDLASGPPTSSSRTASP